MANQGEFTGHWALITGGTKGLGLSTAELLAAQGCQLLLSYRSDTEGAEAAARELSKKFGVTVRTLACDQTENDATERLWTWAATESGGRLHHYVHNAAATAFKPLLEIQSHHIDKTFNLTLKSLILALPKMKELMKGGGTVVTVSGMDTLRAVPLHGLLGVAKSALETLTAYVSHELGNDGVRANCVNPGFLRTDSTKKYLGPMFEPVAKAFAAMTPSGEDARLEDIASVIVFLLSEKSRWLNGQVLNADGGADFALQVEGKMNPLAKGIYKLFT
ncbi:MAG: SDR family oxidoreductase [Bdellovibrionales bacterium]|nr:SDR family oxidoreductase [Bdellovibrionales bacterium]